MKPPTDCPPLRRPVTRPTRRHGVALILVLAFLVLISGLVIAFFMSVTTELSTAKTYSSGVATRQLADSAVTIVMGHIREATAQSGTAWASQPGMIRVYDEKGAPQSYYKLYSSDTLIVGQSQIAGFKPENDLLANWDARPSQFVDLNSPVLSPEPGNPTGPLKPEFPIVDPRAIDNGVEGFDYSGNIGGATSLAGVVTTSKADDKDQRRLPMPVRWIYMLRNGKLTTPTDADATSATWDAAKMGNSDLVPTASNPIVGRLAFWTDDDSSKLNVNTASEGTYWDTPIAQTKPSADDIATNAGVGDNLATPTGTGDWQLAEYQGAQKEYQRYPGHPSTTCLSAIFGQSIVSKTKDLTSKGQAVDRGTIVKAITDLTPRITDLAVATANSSRSSLGGTQQAATAKDGAVGLKVDSDRLYANVDEFIFDPSRTVQGLGDDFRNTIESARFFLTANSRAPEENLFGKPRVAIWPITKGSGKVDDPTDVSKMTTYDKLIARAATVGDPSSKNSLQYYFSRENPKSQTVDWGVRNKAIYTYLQKLTARNTPGFGGNYLSKYPMPSVAGAAATERDQILTEIFDYIRCTNLVDSSEGATKAYTDPTQSADFATNRGWVVPIKPTAPAAGTRGFGRIATISEMALVCIALQPDASGKVNGVTVPAGNTMVEVNLVPELFCPMAGFSALSENMKIKFTKINLTIAGKANAFGTAPYSELKSTDTDTGRISNGNNVVFKIGGSMGIGTLTEPSSGSIKTPDDSVYPSAEVLVTGVPGAGKYFTIQGGTVTADIISPANSTNVIQSFTFNFQQEDVLIPTIVTGGTTPGGRAKKYGEYALGGTGSKIKGTRLSDPLFEQLIHSEDTVRSMSPNGGPGKGIGGDYRLIAARETVNQIDGKDIFRGLPPAPPYKYHGIQGSYRVGRGDVYAYPGFEAGKLVKDINYRRASNRAQDPDVPIQRNVSGEINNGVINSLGQPGDWDNGPALVPDGAYLNKADEGMTAGWTTSYIGDWLWGAESQQNTTFFSPNRQMPSPVMFGSLPTGVIAGKPWQTLLFRPKNLIPNASGTATYVHPGAADFTKSPVIIPDHLLLDLFWMPIVEPYAISEPFSTAGKINLNYQLAPFTYIKRSTGLRAVLRSVMISCINPSDLSYGWPQGWIGFSRNYKMSDAGSGSVTRRAIDATETLKQFDDRFARTTHTPANPNFFVSPSEICDVLLVPKTAAGGLTASNVVSDFWKKNILTGDNSLERPYTHIYPRVTTKSNTYTVHVRVQSLKKLTTDKAQNVWNEQRDQIAGEYRGSYVVERYLDPETAGFYKQGKSTDPSDENDPDAILGPYRFRVISSKQFGQ